MSEFFKPLLQYETQHPTRTLNPLSQLSSTCVLTKRLAAITGEVTEDSKNDQVSN